MGCVQSRGNKAIPDVLIASSRQEWIEWKHRFLTYVDENCVSIVDRRNEFYKCIGYQGENVANNLYIDDDDENSKNETKLEHLLFKFDVYFLYVGVERSSDQTVDEYVLYLQKIARATVDKHIHDIVKEKILQDMKSENIFERIKKLPLSSRPTSSRYEGLSLSELKFLWNECERAPRAIETSSKKANKKKQKQIESKPTKIKEKNEIKKCGANKGKRCHVCGDPDHLARSCSATMDANKGCGRCGSSRHLHHREACPALDERCSRCKEFGHFAWRCKNQIIKSCVFCGEGHLADRRYCRAFNNFCDRCCKSGHLTSRCPSAVGSPH